MLVVTRLYDGGDPAGLELAGEAALDALGQRAGFVRGRLGRAPDDPSAWVFTTEWLTVGAWRRALSAYDVKLAVTPLLSRALDEVSAYEIVVAADTPGPEPVMPSDRLG